MQTSRARHKIRQWIRQTLSSSSEANLFETLTDHFARILISEALNMTEGNRSRTAKLIGLSRPTLLSKIEKYKISMKTAVTGTEEADTNEADNN